MTCVVGERVVDEREKRVSFGLDTGLAPVALPCPAQAGAVKRFHVGIRLVPEQRVVSEEDEYVVRVVHAAPERVSHSARFDRDLCVPFLVNEPPVLVSVPLLPCDVLSDLEMLQTLYPDAVAISAKTGFGLDELRQAVTKKYKGGEILLRVMSSQSNGKVQSYLRAHGRIINEQYLDSSVLIDARLGRNQLPDLKKLKPENIEIIQS